MKVKTIILLILLSVANVAAAATSLPPSELHRLASYLSYITVGVDTKKPGGGSLYTIGSNCPECLGVGEVGDGRTMLPCGWEDGLFYCNKGKIAKRSDGDAMDSCEIGCALCETLTDSEAAEMTEQLESSGGFTQESQELFDTIENVSEDWNESTVRDLGCKLEDSLEALGEEQESPDILCFKGNAWTFEDKRINQASNADMVKHLVEVHNIDPDSASKMDREELIALHNLLHNSEVRSSAPKAESSCPSGSCPSGTCPSSSSRGSSSSSRRGLFGWRR